MALEVLYTLVVMLFIVRDPLVLVLLRNSLLYKGKFVDLTAICMLC